MRATHVTLLALVAGVAVGVAAGYHKSAAPIADGASPVAPLAGPASNDARPKAAIDEATYQFGDMQLGTTRSHEFIVRNEGNAGLTLEVVGTSCKCTVGDVANKPVPPGGAAPVSLEWVARSAPGPFRQVATIGTNDPAKPTLELAVEGNVVKAAGLEPSDFHFGEVRSSHEKSVSVYFYSLERDDLEVTAEAPVTEGGGGFDVQVTPVGPDELPTKAAKSGYRITLTAKPGLPIGSLMEWVKLKTNLEETPELEAPVFGRVVGDITVHGAHWSEAAGVLRMGLVRSAEGAKEKLILSVKGEHAADTRFDVIETDPPELKVEIGKPVARGKNTTHTEMTVEVPAGTRSMIHLNTDQGDDGMVRLKTTHPDVQEVRIGVRFAVAR